MPLLFGLDIAGIVATSLDAAGGLLPATLTVVTQGTRTVGAIASGTNPTEVSYPCKGLISTFSVDRSGGFLAGVLIQAGDRIVSLLGATIGAGAIEPKMSDRVTIEGRTYTIVGPPDRDPAGAMWDCHVRG